MSVYCNLLWILFVVSFPKYFSSEQKIVSSSTSVFIHLSSHNFSIDFVFSLVFIKLKIVHCIVNKMWDQIGVVSEDEVYNDTFSVNTLVRIDNSNPNSVSFICHFGRFQEIPAIIKNFENNLDQERPKFTCHISRRTCCRCNW